MIQVLDHGSIELIDVMGRDTTVVNTARVSFAKRVDEMSEKDEKLISYLAAHKHVSPFYHPHLMFRVKAPISVQRQWFKHKIGTAENSESTRYTEVHDEYYVPDKIRRQSKNNKQGSSDKPFDVLTEIEFTRWYVNSCMSAFETYTRLVDKGVAKEQAREVLPLCTSTSWIWTASLMAVAHFIELRDEEHAQWEIREYAKAMRTLAEQRFPISLRALLKSGKTSSTA